MKTENGTKTTYTYNALNQLVKENDTVYKYDDAGNLVSTTSSGKSAAYTYNAENKLIRATVQEGNNVSVEEYEYDYAGNRTVKKSENDYTYYLNDVSGGLTQVLAELDSNGNEKCYYTRGTEIISQERSGNISYYLTDGHCSVRQLADSTGAVTDTYVYDAWGNLISSTGDTENSYLYCGEQLDSTTGLYYLRARYMNPTTGTFISMDTYQGSIFEPVTLHKYLYANANPVTYCDPSGYMFGQTAVLNMRAQETINAMAVYKSLKAALLGIQVGIMISSPVLVIFGTAIFENVANGVMTSENVSDAVREETIRKHRKNQKIGWIVYEELDELDRATGAMGYITPNMLRTGSRPAVDPKDYVSGKGYARGHLIAKVLGGSGKDRRNLVTIYQNPVNSPDMRDLEVKIKDAVSCGENVLMIVRPIYCNDSGIPLYINMVAFGESGFNLMGLILNVK